MAKTNITEKTLELNICEEILADIRDAEKRPTDSLIRDIDPDARITLRQREQCLERRKETAGHRAGATGMVAAAH
jgi:hypothetical protein